MALRYWRGGNGFWSSTNSANWSTTSGGTGGASIPGSADDVIFDTASAVSGAAYTCSFAAGYFPTINSLNISGPAVNTLTFGNTSNTGSGCAIIGNFTVAAARVSMLNFQGQWVMFGTKTISTNGTRTGNAGGSGIYLNRGTLTWSTAWNGGGTFYVGPQTGGGNLVLNFSNIQHRNFGGLLMFNSSTQTVTVNWGGSSGRLIIDSTSGTSDWVFFGNTNGVGDITETNLTPGTNGFCLGNSQGVGGGVLVGTSNNTLPAKYPTITAITDGAAYTVVLNRDTWGAPLWMGNLYFQSGFAGTMQSQGTSQTVVNYVGSNLTFSTSMSVLNNTGNPATFNFQNATVGGTTTFNGGGRIINGFTMAAGSSFVGTLNVSNIGGGSASRGGWTVGSGSAGVVNFASTVTYTAANPCLTFTQNSGTTNFTGSTLFCTTVNFAGGTANLGTGNFFMTGNWTTASGVTFSGGTSTITFQSTSTVTNQTLTGGQKTYNLIVNNTAAQAAGIGFNGGGFTFADSGNTITTLRISNTNNITTKFISGTNNTINAIDTTLITGANRSWWGTANNAGVHTITKTSGTINVSRLNIQQSTATGGAAFNSFVGSGSTTSNNNTNLAVNSGWQFTNIPAVSGFFNFF
jgi:hypothetical protein